MLHAVRRAERTEKLSPHHTFKISCKPAPAASRRNKAAPENELTDILFQSSEKVNDFRYCTFTGCLLACQYRILLNGQFTVLYGAKFMYAELMHPVVLPRPIDTYII